MKIYIMTDMECVSGITCAEFLNSQSPSYEVTKRNLTLDVNAVVEGCFQAGATEVHVKDGHGIPNNLQIDILDKRVTINHGGLDSAMGIDSTFDAYMMVGQHAQAGTLNAFLDHTQSSAEVFDYTVNGISLGEIGQSALIAGHYDVPIVFLTGDDAGCQEAEALLPGIETVSVGSACGNGLLSCKNPEAVREEMTIKVQRSLKRDKSEQVVPYKLKLPLCVQLTFQRTEMADGNIRLRSNKKRIDGRTVEMTVDQADQVLSIFV